MSTQSNTVPHLLVSMTRNKWVITGRPYRLRGDGQTPLFHLARAQIYHDGPSRPRQGQSRSSVTLAHYLFARFGYENTLAKFDAIVDRRSFESAAAFAAESLPAGMVQAGTTMAWQQGMAKLLFGETGPMELGHVDAHLNSLNWWISPQEFVGLQVVRQNDPEPMTVVRYTDTWEMMADLIARYDKVVNRP